MKLRALSFLVVACVGLSAQRSSLAQGIPCAYEVAHVIQAPDGPFGSSPTGATAISPNGRYVCGSFNPGGIGFDRAFVYDTATEQFIILPLPPGGYQSGCNAVNDAGLAVGSYWVSGGVQPQRGFVYDIAAGQYVAELLPLPGASWCVVTGINSSNTLCGWRSIGSKGDPVNPQTAFIWSAKDGFNDLGVMTGPSSGAMDISDRGTVVGWTGAGFSANAAQAFVLSDGHLTILPFVPDGFSSAAAAVNEAGAIAVYGRMDFFPGIPHGFVHRDNAYSDLGLLPGFSIMFVEDIADDGTVVGILRTLPVTNDRGFVWRAGLLRNLDHLIVTARIDVSWATGIAENGTIVATARNQRAEVVSVVLAPVVVNGDADGNCRVDIDDLLTVIGWWGPGSSLGDLSGDDVVDITDLLLVIENWTR